MTGRAAVLALVVAVLAMTLAFPLRQYVAQRAEIAALEQTLAEHTSRVDALTTQKLRWKDRAYVEAQARARLHYVYPGEIGYVLLSPSDVRRARDPKVTLPAVQQPPWFQTLWASVRSADAGGRATGQQ